MTKPEWNWHCVMLFFLILMLEHRINKFHELVLFKPVSPLAKGAIFSDDYLDHTTVELCGQTPQSS